MDLGLSLGSKSSKRFHGITGKAPDEFTETTAAAQTFPSAAGGYSSLSFCMALTINPLNGTNQKQTDDGYINEDCLEPRNDAIIMERASSRASDEDENGFYRKKLRLTKQQSAYLEDSFKYHPILNHKQKHDLAKKLKLSPRQVEVWFQNRRARTKLKQTEMDYEYLKKCYEVLRGENKRLCKEVQELRALKTPTSNPFNVQLPTTLIVCPSCERISQSTTTTTSVPPHTKPRRSMSATSKTPFPRS